MLGLEVACSLCTKTICQWAVLAGLSDHCQAGNYASTTYLLAAHRPAFIAQHTISFSCWLCCQLVLQLLWLPLQLLLLLAVCKGDYVTRLQHAQAWKVKG